MRILFIGDIFGRPGRRVVAEKLPALVAAQQPALVVANCENAAAGIGITPPLVEELLGAGIDVLTSGNHIWDRKEILPYFEHGAANGRLLRPANYPRAPGTGLYLAQTPTGVACAVLNLQGRVFMPDIDCPFKTADRLLEGLPREIKVIVVDMHAETTSEKQAMGFYLDGRVSAVLGTHTHVPTADEKILPGGTAYLTDVGMTGPYGGVIGNATEGVLRRFLTSLPTRLEVAEEDVQLCGVLLEIDEATGRAHRIERFALGQDRK
ncbi:MAG: TIGR00282 family metallophosphoesterase [Terriglobia bacterium]